MHVLDQIQDALDALDVDVLFVCIKQYLMSAACAHYVSRVHSTTAPPIGAIAPYLLYHDSRLGAPLGLPDDAKDVVGQRRQGLRFTQDERVNVRVRQAAVLELGDVEVGDLQAGAHGGD